MFSFFALIASQSIGIQGENYISNARQMNTIDETSLAGKVLENNFMKGYENYRDIIIEGRGMNEKEASLNATTKALQQVAGIFMDVRETLFLDVTESNNMITENKDRHEFTQSFYSDGAIRSFEKLAIRRKDGFTIVIA